VNKVEVKAATAAGSAGTTINLPAGVVVAGQFTKNNIQQPLFYVEINTGASEGFWSDIDSNTATALTVTDAIGGLAPAGTTVTVRKHHTFNTLFGDTQATVKLTPGLDLSTSDAVQLFNPVTQLPTSYFFNLDDLNPAGVGWVNTKTGVAAGNEVIAPGVGMVVVRKNGAASGVIQVGHVKTGKTVLAVEPALNFISIPRATPVKLSESGLQASGLQGGFDLSTADNIVDLFNNTPTSFFFSIDDLDPGWQPSDGNLREGTAVKYLRRGAAFNWVVPAQPIAP
jgi:uncharacterized protein (TIGR02597 family)